MRASHAGRVRDGAVPAVHAMHVNMQRHIYMHVNALPALQRNCLLQVLTARHTRRGLHVHTVSVPVGAQDCTSAPHGVRCRITSSIIVLEYNGTQDKH
jgi:hypothetical protein